MDNVTTSKYQLRRMFLINAGTNKALPSNRITVVDPRGGALVKTLKNGALVIDYEDGPRLDVDMDGAADFLTFLADDYIRDYCHHEYSDWTEGFRIYQRLGILSLGAGHSRKMDEILRRSQWLQSQELHGQRTPEEVKAKCSVRYENQALLF